MKRLIVAAAVAALSTPAALAHAQTAQGGLKFIHAGRLLADPASGKVETDKTLVVRDGRIVEIRDGFVGEGEIVDLRDSFVLPGLIDSHVHITHQQGPNVRLEQVTESAAAQAITGAGYAAKTLKAGFTTVADLGGDNEAVFALREGIRTGEVAGPRILAAGSSVTPHGGHGDAHSFREDVLHVISSPSACSGADECRKAVRMQVKYGADLIKITATGGVLSNTKAGLGQQFMNDELAAIVETAHALGRRVTAHAHGVDGVNAALVAGVDSIEHGTFADAESFKLYKKNGAYLVPTLMAGDFVTRVANGSNNFFSPAQAAKAREAGPKMLDMTRRARQAGVNIAFGTDSGVSAHGDNAQEFALLVKAGLTPLEAVQAATVKAADHLQIADEVGALKPGMAADVIAVKGDPLADVTVLERVAFVMKGGEVYKN